MPKTKARTLAADKWPPSLKLWCNRYYVRRHGDVTSVMYPIPLRVNFPRGRSIARVHYAITFRDDFVIWLAETGGGNYVRFHLRGKNDRVEDYLVTGEDRVT